MSTYLCLTQTFEPMQISDLDRRVIAAKSHCVPVSHPSHFLRSTPRRTPEAPDSSGGKRTEGRSAAVLYRPGAPSPRTPISGALKAFLAMLPHVQRAHSNWGRMQLAFFAQKKVRMLSQMRIDPRLTDERSSNALASSAVLNTLSPELFSTPCPPSGD